MIYDCLIIDDEKELTRAQAEYFNMFGVKTYAVNSVEEFQKFMINNSMQVVLLDINLGNDSGFDVCKKIREKLNIPIIFISARESDDDILLGLQIGGDDYIKKPCSLSVLLAKIKVVLKRQSGKKVENIEMSDLVLNPSTLTVTAFGEEKPLKMMEYKLLKYFMENPNRVISKDEIFQNVWKESYATDGTLNVHVRHLREKIEKDVDNPDKLKTVWGIGYMFNEK